MNGLSGCFTVDARTGEAVARFYEQALLAYIYSGQVREAIVHRLVGCETCPDDTFTATFSITTLHNDIAMMRSVSEGPGLDVEIGLERGD